MTRIPASGVLAVQDRLRSSSPDLQVPSVTTSTLIATSHLIETPVYDHGERCLLVSGFQHGRHQQCRQHNAKTCATVVQTNQ